MYEPTAIPSGSGLRSWLSLQLRQVADALRRPEVLSLRLVVHNAEPSKYAEGDIVRADGTNWNPGSGAGAYLRVGGAWVKL